MAEQSYYLRPTLDWLSLGEPLQRALIRVPQNVWFEDDDMGGSLCYRPDETSFKEVGAGQDRLLTDFMRLAEASPEDTVAFAEKFGVLELCRHNLPASHVPRRMWPDLAEDGSDACWAVRSLGQGGVTRERFTTWIRLASQARATHRAAGLLAHGDAVPDEDWNAIRDLLPQGMVITAREYRSLGFEPREDSIQDQRKLLMMALQRWLDLGDVGFRVRWEGTRPSFTYGGTGLAGAVALQLGLTCTSTFGFTICSFCHLPHTPRRRPRPGESNYCPDCRTDGVPGRVRQQRHRAKQTAKGQL